MQRNFGINHHKGARKCKGCGQNFHMSPRFFYGKWSAKMIDILYFRGFASPFMHCNSDDVKIASPATKTNYISMMSRQSFDQVNELTWLIFLE